MNVLIALFMINLVIFAMALAGAIILKGSEYGSSFEGACVIAFINIAFTLVGIGMEIGKI